MQARFEDFDGGGVAGIDFDGPGDAGLEDRIDAEEAAQIEFARQGGADGGPVGGERGESGMGPTLPA